MKSKGIILIALLCIFAISGCSKETNTTAADSETRSTQIIASEETSAKNEMTIVLKDNETGNLLENKVVEDEEKITAFNQMCGGLKNPTQEELNIELIRLEWHGWLFKPQLLSRKIWQVNYSQYADGLL